MGTPLPQYSGKQTKVELSTVDRIQAILHHPKFRYYLAVQRDIQRKDLEVLPLTNEEAAVKNDRSGFAREAEEEVRYRRLTRWLEREQAQRRNQRAWRRELLPDYDPGARVLRLEIPLSWPNDRIEQTVRPLLSTYRRSLRLNPELRALRQSVGLPVVLPPETLLPLDCQPKMFGETLRLTVPLDHPISRVMTAIMQLVGANKQALGLVASREMRDPEQVDKWAVYRLKHDKALSLAAITEQLCNAPAYLAYGEGPSPEYFQVRRAYRSALRALRVIDAELSQ